MSIFDGVVWGVAAVLLVPVLLSPVGWIVGAVVALAWILGAYGGRYLLQVERERRQGERGLAKDLRTRNQGEDP